MPIPIGPFQTLNHGHARKQLEDYLDYRWLLAPIRRHDPKGLILSHFQKLGLMTLYRHEVHPDDSFEDTRVFEDPITRMRLRHIPKERIVVLGQDPDLDRMEWRRQCFEAGPSQEKDDETDKEKEQEKEKEKSDNPFDKEKLLLKEIVPSRPKDPEISKEIPTGFDPKSTADPSSEGKDPKNDQTPKARDSKPTQKTRSDSQALIDPLKLAPLSSRSPEPETQEDVMPLSKYKFN